MTDAMRERFADLVACADDEISLAQTAMVIATIETPDLRERDALDALDHLVDRVADRLPQTGSSTELISALSIALFEVEGFRGNARDYFDPRNSCLDCVLDRRLGIPISLSVLYLEIAWRLGFPVSGVGFPGHFLVKWEVDEGQVVVDPFHNGVSRTLAELNAQARLAGATADARALLNSCTRRDIIVRMLRNLTAIYAHLKNTDRQLHSLDLLLIAAPDALAERIVRARLLESLGCIGAAIDDLMALRDQGLRELPDGNRVAAEIARLSETRPVLH